MENLGGFCSAGSYGGSIKQGEAESIGEKKIGRCSLSFCCLSKRVIRQPNFKKRPGIKGDGGEGRWLAISIGRKDWPRIKIRYCNKTVFEYEYWA